MFTGISNTWKLGELRRIWLSPDRQASLGGNESGQSLGRAKTRFRSADRAPRFCVLRRGQDVPSIPRARAPFLACGILPPLRSGFALDLLLTNPIISCRIRKPAALRSDGRPGSSQNSAAFLSEPAITFGGIPSPCPFCARPLRVELIVV
jgi:hypothetical protein